VSTPSDVKKVLITGGGGFLGAWILRLLHSQGILARIFELKDDRRHIEMIAAEAGRHAEWVTGDVADTEAMIEAARDCDAIIHLAGLMTPACQANPLLGARVNVIGTLNAFEAAKTHGISHVTYTSSGGVFGLEDDQAPFPLTHYGAFKLANEGNARAYWEDAGISSFGFRPFVIYGPGRDAGLTAGISLACLAAARGEAYSVAFSGPIALVYVEDVARAYVEAMMQKTTGAKTANLSGHATTVEETVRIIHSVTGLADISISGEPIPSLSTARNEWDSCGLKLPAEHSLAEGLAKTIAFSRA